VKVLTLNAGSNSLKFEIVENSPGGSDGAEQTEFGQSILAGAYDDVGKEGSAFSLRRGRHSVHREEIEIRDHAHATDLLFDWIERGGARERGIQHLEAIDRIGHRIVHGADFFTSPVELTDEAIAKIKGLEDLAPLHNVSALKVVRAARAKLGRRFPMIAVFDTVFHRTIPDHAGLYPIPIEVAQRHKIRRYGFHGISHRYMMLRYSQIARRPASDLKLITLHLEGGSSAAAIENGKSIDNSMGFTPLEGLMMGTRSGDIDPAIVTYLMRKEHKDAGQMEQFLNKECGLLGVSRVSADTRTLREQLSDERVNLAVNMFCYRVRKYVGAYLTALGGVDAIVAGGGISENTAVVRERIFRDFNWCGAVLDEERNRTTVDCEGPITTAKSSLPIWVIPTEEGLMIAKDVADYDMPAVPS
jgi:acetate kinase